MPSRDKSPLSRSVALFRSLMVVHAIDSQNFRQRLTAGEGGNGGKVLFHRANKTKYQFCK